MILPTKVSMLRLLCLCAFVVQTFNGFAQGRPPFITNQPLSQIVAAGTNVTFTVGVAASSLLLSYQWQHGLVPIPGETNPTLVLTNVQLANAGPYSVTVANAAGAVPSDPATLTILQVVDQSVSLGANVLFQVTARGSAVGGFQWQFHGVAIPGATNSSLTITNVQLINAGAYSVFVTNTAGSAVASATLDVDSTFTKITTGSIVADNAGIGCAWGDYNDDGFLDLFVTSGTFPASEKNLIYRNNGDGTFTNVTAGPVATDIGQSATAAWGDYDNDGLIDLFVGNYQERSFLYRNTGNGAFTSITAGSIVKDTTGFGAGVWGDYDNDGFLDMFVGGDNGQKSLLYHNNSDGTFSKITTGPPVNIVTGTSGSWADYDNDGYPDLFVFNLASGNRNFLFHNRGDGTFTQVKEGPLVNDPITHSRGGAWGDYDNDGFLDLFVANGTFLSGQFTNYLYHNNGDGTFTKITAGNIVTDRGSSASGAWEDFDNDGYLDLFVSHTDGQNNALYRNNGDGTFTKITTGSLVNDGGNSRSAAWGDYDNDGFPDLFVANQYPKNFLYRNNGNSNSWITFKCKGRVSNRSAIGAKVRVKSVLNPQESVKRGRQWAESRGKSCLRRAFCGVTQMPLKG